jgi:hypothetical protein
VPSPVPAPPLTATPRGTSNHQGGGQGITVDQPALARLGSMVAQVLEEVHTAPIDTAGRDRIHAIHALALVEIRHQLPAELRRELDRLSGQPESRGPASLADLRIAQAQVVGWLEGIFAGARFAAAIEHATGSPACGAIPEATTVRAPR